MRKLLCLEDSDEEPKKVKKRKIRAISDQNSSDEQIDVEKDEEDADEEDETLPTHVRREQLSKTGQDLQKLINQEEKGEASDDKSDESDIDLDSDSDDQALNAEQIVCAELRRLGKVTFKEIFQACKQKKLQIDNKELSRILNKVAEKMGHEKDLSFVLKEEFRKTIPSHGARIDYNITN